MKRDIIKIDELLCNGCGLCVNGCHEGALQLIDGKAMLISELYCDGLGACVGDCPVGAITIEQRESEPYDEDAVMERIVSKGNKVVAAHLNHLKSYGENKLYRQGIDYIERNNISFDFGLLLDYKQSSSCSDSDSGTLKCGCPGSMERSLTPKIVGMAHNESRVATSELTHWPVQLHLLNPQAGFFREADVVIAADCTAFAYADFHNKFIKNRSIAIGCPKLDSGKDVYLAKITEMIDVAKINTLTVVIMEVPCCSGLMKLVVEAAAMANRKIPIKSVIISVNGEIKEEKWL